MAEILPTAEGEQNVEHFIGFLMQADAVEGAVSSEHASYADILARWRVKQISDDEAMVEATNVSAGRGQNYH